MKVGQNEKTIAETDIERINLSPFTKDFRVFVSLRQVVMFLCLVLPGPLIEFSFLHFWKLTNR